MKILRTHSAAIFFLFLLLMTGCKKPENLIGLDVQPGEDALGFDKIDTLAFITYSIPGDSIRSDEFSQQVLGEYNDRYLGRVKAGVAFQLRTASQNISFRVDSISIDSVVLHMRYGGFYGNLDAQRYAVYRLTGAVHPDTNYYNNFQPVMDVSKNWIVPGQEVVVPKPFTLITVGTDTAAPPQLRLRLLNELGDSLINIPTTGLASADAFVEAFKGLVVVTENPSMPVGSGGLAYLSLIDNATGLTIYYREQIGGTIDTTRFTFPITTRSARITFSEFDQTGTALAQQFADSTLGMTRFFVQGVGGAKGVVYFPHLEKLRDMNIIINKAELILPVEFYTASSFTPVSRLFLTRLNEEGKEVTIPDINEGDSHTGGFYSNADKAYRLLITRYVQQVASGKIDHAGGLRVVTVGAASDGSRTYFNGPSTTNKKKPQLIIHYTTY
jgi:hypothetical protein